jgi:hypothetical protein
MAGKSIQQRLSEADTRIQQLEAQKRMLAQQMKAQERKERTRRLIQIGAVFASLGVDTIAKAQALQQEIERQPEVQAWLRSITEGAS